MQNTLSDKPGPGPEEPWFFLRGVQQVSFCDWPERITCVLFLGGCNLACPTCHNWQLAKTYWELPVVPWELVFSHLLNRQGWLDGVVISGGEPTCCPGLTSLLQEITATGLEIKLDTNGLNPTIIRDLLIRDLVQLFAVDVKGPWHKYPLLTGNKCSTKQARGSLEQIFALAREYPERFYFRLTMVPSLQTKDIEETKSYLPSGFDLHLQDYVPPAGTKEQTTQSTAP
jgi:pyruvate formate lyase activating enzyme